MSNDQSYANFKSLNIMSLQSHSHHTRHGLEDKAVASTAEMLVRFLDEISNFFKPHTTAPISSPQHTNNTSQTNTQIPAIL